MNKIIWKFSFTLYISSDIQLSGKSINFGSKNVSSFKKQLIGEVESFLKLNFGPKPRMQNSANTKPLNLELLTQPTCFIFLSWLQKCFEVTENVQKSSLKETRPSYGQKCVCSENPGQNIWHKVKKYIKIGQDFKNIICNFAYFFYGYCQRLTSGRKTGRCAVSPPTFDIFLKFSNFLRS